MRRIAVFGKPGGGKSTLSRRLASAFGVKLYPLDLIEYYPDGRKKSLEEYNESHSEILKRDAWIIDGLGTLDSFWKRVDSADTLIYIDLPYWQHYWLTAKRLLKSPFVKPEGWPEGSSVFKGTLSSWKYLRLSPAFWTADFLSKIKARAEGKTFYHLKSISELDTFLKD
ncbi:MAG TPA: hypothetical protein PL048_04545 [Leptospiraceae bacterium]|nr:hypothetical protein [Leptospiraceae bacterium]HMY68036.1 hypothetical protein [Leptospiraceae bacterium]HMZ58018.1 hypothetical protein [Leptospiraceae bacterium]HNF16599.1 hypothetical protein [Leptospiraceae bacterium]HNF23604.1 hypothetical protein [Leptospiraceae bacterium]